MGTQACALCKEAFNEDELVYSEGGKICRSCELDTSVSFSQGASPALYMAGLFAVVPFFLWYVTGEGLTSFGVGLKVTLMPPAAGQEHVAFFAGLCAMVAGAVSIKSALGSKDKKTLIASAVCVILGLVHVVVRSGYLF